MKKNKIWIIPILILSIMWSCDPNRPDSIYVNTAPKVNDHSFSALENISDKEIIGKLTASDVDEDKLTFTIEQDDSGLFALSSNGVLRLATGKSLDYGTAQEHILTIKVHDGIVGRLATVTIQVENVNIGPPIIEDQFFEAAEDISDIYVIGEIQADDADGDVLSYSIVQNDNELFELSENGELSLKDGERLDFESAGKHEIQISVSDGTEEASAIIQIVVLNVIEMHEEPESFVTKWEIPSDGFEEYIGTNENYAYDFVIDWGDGTIEEYNFENTEFIAHTFEEAGTYTVAIQGDFPAFVAKGGEDIALTSLISIEQWGSIPWKSFQMAFAFCTNLGYNADDVPDLSNVTNMSRMFLQSSFDGDISGWDTSTIENMSHMFYFATNFNAAIGNWDVSNVTTMNGMFFEAQSFDQDLGSWNIGSITDMLSMFHNCGMSPSNMNSTLIGWADFVNQNGGPTNITCGMGGITVCGPEVDMAGMILVNDNGWDFPGITNVFNCP
tara:strand:+ start:5266 stop:6765 length:1500 start_codon:yes stop_codon:yes gene_type:complete